MRLKKTVAVAGAVIAGAAVVVATQGSAQAAPVKPVAAPATVQQAAGADQPQAILSAVTKAAQKAAVHVKAAAGSKAGKSLGNISEIGSLFGAPPVDGTTQDGVKSVDVAFDK